MKLFFPYVISILIFSTQFTYSQLVINEFMASNSNNFFDEFGEDNDWVEIYNISDTSIDMGGMYFTDDLTNGTLHKIPNNETTTTTIEPGGFLVFWFDKDIEQGSLHVDCKLSSDGEQIGLFAADGTTIIDSLTFSAQETNISFGRINDGDNNWVFSNYLQLGSDLSIFSRGGQLPFIRFKFHSFSYLSLNTYISLNFFPVST